MSAAISCSSAWDRSSVSRNVRVQLSILTDATHGTLADEEFGDLCFAFGLELDEVVSFSSASGNLRLKFCLSDDGKANDQ